ncbi:hypothetical protein CANCADRAFT_3213 [Tortispora caseinolytica NRRL Y-17796]|uniref:DASH complex subunit DAM1 n=1 Tax=Tortispora caseinolytica NRRL Y-17796 TaxID=767744 RepID=A0A1E4TA00_9ASCO|nr:hypothetical protein CANCADRAFT_3213 [Tortispora caseinolytica NRRL Y-17796]
MAGPHAPVTPLRKSSNRVTRKSARSHEFVLPRSLNEMEPTIQEFADAVSDFEVNLESFQVLNNQVRSFNENFGAFLYGLEMNAWCVDFPGVDRILSGDTDQPQGRDRQHKQQQEQEQTPEPVEAAATVSAVAEPARVRSAVSVAASPATRRGKRPSAPVRPGSGTVARPAVNARSVTRPGITPRSRIPSRQTSSSLQPGYRPSLGSSTGRFSGQPDVSTVSDDTFVEHPTRQPTRPTIRAAAAPTGRPVDSVHGSRLPPRESVVRSTRGRPTVAPPERRPAIGTVPRAYGTTRPRGTPSAMANAPMRGTRAATTTTTATTARGGGTRIPSTRR